ncbi:helix-turn-helix domain-containing protein [Aquisediminimonas profunda]|uniref:helix-turn-helix domain-containing protein n=1 Tax=Aquisediminimonas profunda TaxID=1550733 RepID=UPI001C630036|nr:helix-turn-helix transcriptional regulator [Aquisediminimonas profunda]
MREPTAMPSNTHPLADTDAARMLRAGLEEMSERRGISGRTIAKQLGMKTSVMLSHWAIGRVPIPIERAQQLADALGINSSTFLRAVIKQRHPEVNWALLTAPTPEEAAESIVEADLRNLAGRPLAELPAEQLRVLYEVAADPQAPRRWLAVAEINVVEMLRELRPSMREMGLSATDRQALTKALRP